MNLEDKKIRTNHIIIHGGYGQNQFSGKNPFGLKKIRIKPAPD